MDNAAERKSRRREVELRRKMERFDIIEDELPEIKETTIETGLGDGFLWFALPFVLVALTFTLAAELL